MTYRFLPHTADIKVVFEAETLQELFADGTALMSGLLAGSSPVEARTERTVRNRLRRALEHLTQALLRSTEASS